MKTMPRGRIRWGAAVLVAVALCLAPAPACAGSPRVAALQAALQAKGLYTAEVDGVPRTDDARGHHALPAPQAPDRRRRGGAADDSRPRQPRPSATRQSRGHPAERGLGRGGRAVPAVAGRLLSRRHRRRLRSRTARAVYAYQRSTGLRADGMAGRPDDPRPSPRPWRPSGLTRALLQAARRSDGRRLRSHRRTPAHRHRLPGAGRYAREGGRQGRGGLRRLEHAAATATSSWSSTGSASPAGTPTSAA